MTHREPTETSPGLTGPTGNASAPGNIPRVRGAKGGMLPPCAATTRKGTPCNFPAHHGTAYCINHDPAYKDKQRQNVLKGARNSRKARTRPSLNLDHLDLTDRASIQALVEAIIKLEFEGRLPTNRARHIIRLLSLANRNLRTSTYGWVTTPEERHAHRYRTQRHHTLQQLRQVTQSTPDPNE